MLYALCIASDVKVKLNSTNGSTSFQVRDSADVVVSSITSDGNIHTRYGVRASTTVITGSSSGSLDIVAGALKDLTVKNEDLIITSTYVAAASVSAIAENDAWADLSGFYGTLNVTQQPALIYAVFTTSAARQNTGWTMFNFQILANNNVVAYDGHLMIDADKTGWCMLISASGAYRVTATGDVTVKVQQRHFGSMTLGETRFSAFWVPCSP